MKISVIIPAHNEEKYIPSALASAAEAARLFAGETEIVVSLNRCSDKTEKLALHYGAKIVTENKPNLSAVRNAGVKASSGSIIVTMDADSVMRPGTLTEIEKRLSSGKYIGGGALILPERWSMGLIATGLMLAPFIFRFDWTISAGLFWCKKEDFLAIGGFNENLSSVEDLDFARRLKAYGEKTGKKYGTLIKESIVTSCRKMDYFGDWFFIRNPSIAFRLLSGKDKKASDLYYYDFKH